MSGEAAIAVEIENSKGDYVKYTVELKDVGKSVPQVYFNTGENVDRLKTRCWCVIFADMTLNDVVCGTEHEMFLLKFKYGDRIVISDWTERYGLTPSMLKENDEYLGTDGEIITFEDVYNWQD